MSVFVPIALPEVFEIQVCITRDKTKDASWFSPASPLLPSRHHFSVSILLSAKKYTAKTRLPSSDMDPFLSNCSIIPWNRRDCSFFVNNGSQITVDSNKDSSRSVLAILTACLFLSVILAASAAKPPSLPGFLVEMSLHLLSSLPVLDSEEDVESTFEPSQKLPL